MPSTVTIKYLEDVGTFNIGDALEVRQNGVTAFGAAGFVPPSLLSINYHAPYLHNGKAPTLEAVFPLHRLGGGTIASTLTTPERGDLLLFLQSIDGRTVPFRSEGDDFRDAVGLPSEWPGALHRRKRRGRRAGRPRRRGWMGAATATEGAAGRCRSRDLCLRGDAEPWAKWLAVATVAARS